MHMLCVEKQRAKHNIIITVDTLLEPMPIICIIFIFHNCLISLYCIFYLFVASSALSTTPTPSTQSDRANNTTPESVPPTMRTTAASSTEMPLILFSASGKYTYTYISNFLR